MSLNRYKWHIHVLPEDDANRQIANGFMQNLALDASVIQILPPVGGWNKVVDEFVEVHAVEMRKYTLRTILLIIDFDGKMVERLKYISDKIPADLADRVFILGVQTEPEELKRILHKSLEEIGKALSQDCEDNTRTTWECSLLAHNRAQLDRLFVSVRPFLFNSSIAN
jgi:hypothetical protein